MDYIINTCDEEMDQTQNGDVLIGPQMNSNMTVIDSEMDEARSVDTFRLTIMNLSKLEDSVLSPPTYVRNLPWTIMVEPRRSHYLDRIAQKYLGFFVQCNKACKSNSWSCYAVVELRLLSVKPEVKNFTKKINHLFYSKESDWGFPDFIYWDEVLDPEKGYIKDDTITLEVQVSADAPQVVSWTSIKPTGAKEKFEAHRFMMIKVLLEDQFDGHQGNDLYDPENVHFHLFMLRKQTTVAEMMKMLAAAFKYPPEQIRPWPISLRFDDIMRPELLDVVADLHKSVIDAAENINPWIIFLEVLSLDSGRTSLPTFDQESDVLLFFKMYDPKQKKIHYCGHAYVPRTRKLRDIFPMLNQRAGFAPGTDLLLYEENGPNMIEKINNFNEPIEYILEDLMDGDIIIFEKREGYVNSALPTCIDYFEYLFYRVEVTFINKMIPNDQGLTVELSQQMTYDQFAHAVAQRIGTDPYLLQFFKIQSHKDSPLHPLRYTFEGTLTDLLVLCKPKVPKKIFYQQLSIRVYELENKKQFKCIYVPANMKEKKELILYPNKNGTVNDLLVEATKQIDFGRNSSQKLRFTEVNRNKLSEGPKGKTPLESLVTNKAYRIEEVSKDEMSLAYDEMLVSCVHFDKKVVSTFGMPFFIKIKEGERFATVKERIQKKLVVPVKELDKFMFIIVTISKSQVLSDDECVVNLSDFVTIQIQEVEKRNEAHLYMTIQVLLEDQFVGHQGYDLYEPENAHFRVFNIKKQATIAEMMNMLADAFKYPRKQIRPWPFTQRPNETMRPYVLDVDADLHKTVVDFAENINPIWNIFLEVMPPDSGRIISLPAFDKEDDILLFFKMYDPKQKKIHYCGHAYIPLSGVLNDIFPMLNQRAGFAPGTDLLFYEEIRPGMIERIYDYDEPFEDILEEMLDGNIIIFEKDEGTVNSDLPTCIDYYNRVDVTFIDKMIPNHQGFTMELSQRLTYYQFARAVAQRVGIDPYLLQFFKCQKYEDSPGHPVRCTFQGTLRDLLVFAKPKVSKKIFYQKLTMRVNQLENKRQFKCIYVPPNMKAEKELILYPNKNGTVDDLLKEASKQIEFGDDSSGKLRFTEVNCNKLSEGPKGETPLESFDITKAYRIEEVPKDEMFLDKDEMLVSCAHFHKEVIYTFGMPFFIKIKEGEPFANVKERIRKKLVVPEKEWEKFKFAIVTMGRTQVLRDYEYVVNFSDFGNMQTQDTGDGEMDQTENAYILIGPHMDPNMTFTDSELDKARSVATFRFTVTNLSKLEDTVLSSPTYIRNLPWKIMLMPRSSNRQDRNAQKSLGFFLQCNGESESNSWSCYAEAELRLLSVKPEVANFTRKINRLFHSKEYDWGFFQFLSWNQVLDPKKGYIKDDTITLEVQVSAEAPQGVSWIKTTGTGAQVRNEADLFMTIQVLLEDQFHGHQGYDLYNPDKAHCRVLKIKKQATIAELMEMLADEFKYPREQIRPWTIWERSNQTSRPHLLDVEGDLHKTVIRAADDMNPWNIFLEVLPRDSGRSCLPTFDQENEVLFFFKMYEPKQKKIHYCGHAYVPKTIILSTIFPMLNQRAGFAPGTDLLLYKEIGPDIIQRIYDNNEPIEDIMDEVMDGDIIIFEKDERDVKSDLPTCIDYYKDLFYRVEVTLVDKMIPNDQGFTMELSQRMTFDVFARAVAQRVGTDPYLLQFFQCQTYKDSPGHPLWCPTSKGPLRDMLVFGKPKKIFYQQMSIRINQLEHRKQFKFIYIPANMKEEKELILYPNKNGTVDDLLEEATKQIEFGKDSSGKLRFTEVNYNKLSIGPKGETPLESLATADSYRIEEVSKDEISLANDEMLVSCAHFHKEVFSTFGMPFFIKIKEGERFANVKGRIQKKLAVPVKEWEKFKFTIVTMGRPKVLSDDEYVINLNDFGTMQSYQNLQLILD